jgi:hypothetical protein
MEQTHQMVISAKTRKNDSSASTTAKKRMM